MKKIKYQGAVTKIIAEKIASYNKDKFLNNSKHIIQRISNSNKVDLDVISFSGTNSFADQLLSICSFIHYAGIPVSWTIYSDNTYASSQIDFFKQSFPFVSVVNWDVFHVYKDHSVLNDYLGFCHLAKKVNVILGHSYERQTIYTDSDVIFYKHFFSYLNNTGLKNSLCYIADASKDISEKRHALNSGFMVLNDAFDKQDVLIYFESLKNNFHYFSEQSSFDFAFKKQNANFLNPNQFIVDTSDQFDFSINYLPDSIALRHYVSPVRHKMWQYGWKWHFTD